MSTSFSSDTVTGPSSVKDAPPREGAGDGSRPGEILVVDDNPANLLAIEAALGDLAMDMQRAQSGTEALRLLLQRDFALILLDVNMPSLDGFETARIIRERKRSRHTPIIFVTAYSRDDREILAAYELGAVDFLFKPIVPEVLRAKVTVFVELQRRTAEVARQAEQLRQNERQLHEQRLEDERRHWEEAALRRQRDEAQRAAEELAQKAEELAATIEEKERIERALIRSNEELAATDRRKDEFLAILGHELRNPLAPLVAGLEILKHNDGGADAATLTRMTRTRDAMERQVKYLARLVDDLLDVSRINSGKIELRRAPVQLADVFEQAVAAVKPALDERQHQLTVSLPAIPVNLVADSVRLTQVVANLLNNAIRYTEERGLITLSCQATDETVTIKVSDNGRGIPADLLPRIFGMFVQEQKGGGGLGLGLTLVERLVGLHGGRVYATSEGSGRGSVFTVELPVHTAADSAVMPAATPAARTAHTNGVSSGELKKIEQKQERAPSREPARPLNIVLVDDNPDIRETMFELLQTWGHTVDCAHDGPSAVELILRVKPDLAFVDIGLPKLDGYGVATEVRLRLGPERTRLVAMSGYGQEADRRRSLESGFNAHLVKPADIDAILNIISSPAPER